LFHVAITRTSAQVTIVPGSTPSPFVAELTTDPPDPDTLRAQRRAVTRAAPTSPSRPKRDRPDHPLLDRSRVMAVVGMVLVDQGQEWTIVGLEPQAALAECGDATRQFPIGSKVETRGRQRGELGPRPGEVDDAAALAFDSLRRFRDRVRDGKPAYTVFDDKTLAAIADRLPGDLGELSGVKGVGPAKLEQYGDDVLAVIATVVSAP
jgi:superfamily II DNA helicase RecQ